MNTQCPSPTVALILAGGLGTRLQSTVPNLPKPMAPVAGRPFLEYLLDHWIAQGIDRFMLSIGHLANAIQDHFGPVYRGCKVDYICEPEPLGTGGALLLARPQLPAEGSFLMLNGDTFVALDLAAAWDYHAKRNSDMTMVLVPHPGEQRYESVACTTEGMVHSLCQREDRAGFWINGGVYLFQSATMLDQEPLRRCSLERDLLPAWLEDGLRVGGFAHRGYFIDIGIPRDYEAAQKYFQTSGG